MFVELALSSIDVDIRYFGFNSFLSFFFFSFCQRNHKTHKYVLAFC